MLNLSSILLRGMTCYPSAADIRPHRSNQKQRQASQSASVRGNHRRRGFNAERLGDPGAVFEIGLGAVDDPPVHGLDLPMRGDDDQQFRYPGNGESLYDRPSSRRTTW